MWCQFQVYSKVNQLYIYIYPLFLDSFPKQAITEFCGVFLLFFFFCHTMWHAGSQFPNQGSKLGLLQWKLGVLTTGPPGKSPLQSIEQSSLCYTVGPYQLSILYIVVCICQSQSPNLSLPPLPCGKHKFVFYICNSVSVSQISSFVPVFQIPHISDII